MESRGQVFFVTMMIAIVFIILALSLAPVIRNFTDVSMNESTSTTVGMNCTSPLLNNYEKADCLFIDYMNPYFTGFLIFAAGAIMAAKLYIG